MEIRENKKETLRSVPLFSELTITQLRKISAVSSVKTFMRGDNLFREGDNYVGFYVLLRGLVKVYNLTRTGKESVIHIVKPINVFADIPLFEGTDYPVSADAVDESITLFIPKKSFIHLLEKNPELALKMLSGFAKRLKALVAQIEDLTTKEVVNRLAKYLLKEIKKNGTDKNLEPVVKITVPKSIVASYLGTITETFSRSLNKLQNEQIIRVKGKKIFIADLNKLKKLAAD